MKILKIVLVLFICSLCYSATNAQYLDNAAGLRLGPTPALTYKKFLSRSGAVEFLLSGRKSGMQLTALYEFHVPVTIAGEDNFFFYYGVGGHIGFVRPTYSRFYRTADNGEIIYRNEKETGVAVGADAIIGLEYQWYDFDLPFTTGIDFKPLVGIEGNDNFRLDLWNIALTLKYNF